MSVIKPVLVWLCLIAVAAIFNGCTERLPMSTASDAPLIIAGQVQFDNQSVPAELEVCWSDGSTEYISTDEAGQFSLTTDRGRPFSLVAATTGLSGNLGINGSTDLESVVVQLAVVESPAEPFLKSADELWFGVYDTDSHGDVRFRYRYSFRRFGCATWLPGYLGENPNPNTWTSWSLSDFPSPWSGRKLLVPRRFQWWHQVVYGWSISRALYLVAWR